MTKLEKKYDELEGFWSPAVRLYIDYFLLQIKGTCIAIAN